MEYRCGPELVASGGEAQAVRALTRCTVLRISAMRTARRSVDQAPARRDGTFQARPQPDVGRRGLRLHADQVLYSIEGGQLSATQQHLSLQRGAVELARTEHIMIASCDCGVLRRSFCMLLLSPDSETLVVGYWSVRTTIYRNASSRALHPHEVGTTRYVLIRTGAVFK